MFFELFAIENKKLLSQGVEELKESLAIFIFHFFKFQAFVFGVCFDGVMVHDSATRCRFRFRSRASL